MTFQALQLTKPADASQPAEVALVELSLNDLPQQSVLIQVAYSTLNYKDALAITNRAPIARIAPLVLGIDGVGQVVESADSRFNAGDQVILNGWGVGERHWGCLAQYARLDADWLIALPATLTPWQSMAIGTAGYTAALAVKQLLDAGKQPQDGPVLVTGASGGVGSYAISLLSTLGFEVVASSGKASAQDYLQQLGASKVIDRRQLSEPGKPLQKEQWSAAIDTVGSHTLANVCAQMQYHGCVAACGLAQGMDFSATVAPFILRGVKLLGVDSVMAPYAERLAAWQLLANHLQTEQLTQIATTISLAECFSAAEAMIASQVTGRLVVDVNQR